MLGFDFGVEYKPGVQNAVADVLLRRDTPDGAVFVISAFRFDYIVRLRLEQVGYPAVVVFKDELSAGSRGVFWGIVDGLFIYDSRIFVPPALPFLQEILAAVYEDGYEGVQRIFYRFRRDFYFSDMRRVVQEFVRVCSICQRNKSEYFLPAGLLLFLPVPSGVWTDIGFDFMEVLPRVRGKSVILTVVDRFSKYAYFILLVYPYSAETVVQVFFSDIVCFYGVFQSIVSDRDAVFIFTFW